MSTRPDTGHPIDGSAERSELTGGAQSSSIQRTSPRHPAEPTTRPTAAANGSPLKLYPPKHKPAAESRRERVRGIPLKNFEKTIDMLRYFEESSDRH